MSRATVSCRRSDSSARMGPIGSSSAGAILRRTATAAAPTTWSPRSAPMRCRPRWRKDPDSTALVPTRQAWEMTRAGRQSHHPRAAARQHHASGRDVVQPWADPPCWPVRRRQREIRRAALRQARGHGPVRREIDGHGELSARSHARSVSGGRRPDDGMRGRPIRVGSTALRVLATIRTSSGMAQPVASTLAVERASDESDAPAHAPRSCACSSSRCFLSLAESPASTT